MKLEKAILLPFSKMISMDGSTLCIGTARLCLADKEKFRLLFEATINAKGQQIKKSEILEHVFGLKKDAYLIKSPVFKRSLDHNVIKLLSRCRIACNKLAREQNLEGVDFFYHCKKSNCWSLAVKHVAYEAVFEASLDAG